VTTQPAPLPAPGTTHSPAPWRVHSQSGTGRYITVKARNGRTVARVPWNVANTPLAECTDARDALTIALAPELLASLEDMVALHCQRSQLTHPPDDGVPWDQRIANADALITRARGE
jgi:hypothetical protein